MNVAKLGKKTAEFMERLEKSIKASDVTNVEVGDAMMIVEMQYRDEEGHECTELFYWTTDQRVWVMRGLLEYMRQSLDNDLLLERMGNWNE